MSGKYREKKIKLNVNAAQSQSNKSMNVHLKRLVPRRLVLVKSTENFDSRLFFIDFLSYTFSSMERTRCGLCAVLVAFARNNDVFSLD